MATPQRKKMAVKTEEEKAEDILSTGSTIKGMFMVFSSRIHLGNRN